MPVKARLLSIALLVPVLCVARDDLPDSLGIAAPTRPAAPEMTSPEPAAPLPPYVEPLRYSSDYLPLSQHGRLPALRPEVAFTPGVAPLAAWESGSAFFAGNSTSLPGLMKIDAASFNVQQTFGPVTISAFAQAMKYGCFRGLSTSWGFGGSATYRVSDRVSLTLFGSYHTGAGLRQPAMAGYTALPRIGGYVDWRFAERWGVRAGAQSYRTADGRRETQPIVEPYFKLGKNCDIGVDVGGILYQVIRSATDGGHRRGNPTLGPPAVHISDIYGQ